MIIDPLNTERINNHPFDRRRALWSHLITDDLGWVRA